VAAVRRRLTSLIRRDPAPGPAIASEYPLRLRARWGWGEPPLGTVAELLARGEPGYEQAVDDAVALADWAAGIAREPTEPGEPAWENDYWGTVDALVQCGALRRRDPALYLEIGSGWSTLFARKAVTDFGLRTRIVSIDPEPRADVDERCDEVVRRPLEECDLTVFDRLEAGDVVFFDGSHTALMNSDATVFFLEVLPRLAPGVLVGVDDIFLPADYHDTWADRIYGEQYLLAAFLLGGALGWTVRFPGWWVVEHSPLAERFAPLWPVVENRYGRTASSFWLERTG
jgi:hypothetical protein